jgi:hypothetical protein
MSGAMGENSGMDTRCARCHAPMSCKPEGDCWCAELPHGPMPVLTAGETTGCLCRNCLVEQLQELERQGKSVG